jgi:putative ABC transport system permease protein
MNAPEALRSAGREIAANPARSLLSFAAMSVGTAALLYTLAQTRGMQRALRRSVEMMGPGAMTVSPRAGYLSRGLSPGLTSDDAAALRAAMPDLYMVYPRRNVDGLRLTYENRTVPDTEVKGVTSEWRRRNWVYALRGRFINERDVAEAARVVVVFEPAGWVKKPFWAGYWGENGAFGDFVSHHDLLGRKILLNERVFTVVGVLTPPPHDKDPRWDFWDIPQMAAPITTCERVLIPPSDRGARHRVDEIRIDAGSERALPEARERVRRLLLARHLGEEDFDIGVARDQLAGRLSQQRKNTAAALALGLVAMLCGGIGIMNVTLAAIFSRVQEIGVRRALGATQLDILAQFLAEAALLGLAGGAAGLALGAGAVAWLSRQAERDLAEMTWGQALLLAAVSCLVSALFSALPAWRASRLDPVEALRRES